MPIAGENILISADLGDYEPVLREELSYGNLWSLILIMTMIVGVSWARINYPKRFNFLMRTFFENRLLRQMMRQEHVLKHKSSYVLYLNFCIAISMFANISLHHFYDFPLTFMNVLWGAVIICGVYVLKIMGISFVRFIFGEESNLSEYWYNVVLGNEFLGIILTPITLAMFFSLKSYLPAFFYSGISLIVIMYLFRIFRGIINSLLNGVSFYYLILYLCTLEILPIAVILKEIGKYS